LTASTEIAAVRAPRAPTGKGREGTVTNLIRKVAFEPIAEVKLGGEKTALVDGADAGERERIARGS
jgi:hypothetical protein